MYTYTKQQRMGGIRFGPQTLVGNWSEEMELQSTTFKAFLAKREEGTLKSTKLHSRLSVALADVEQTKIRDDGFVHFGDVLQLVHVASGCMLAVDVEDKDTASCSATATADIRAPVARNTLLISKYVPERPTPADVVYPGDVLRYGQKIQLLANPMAQGEPLDGRGGSRPLALFSRPQSSSTAARYSGQQLVGFTWQASTYNTVWQVQPINPTDQAPAAGVEVAAGAPLLLVHCATGKPLHLEGPEIKYPNDFGLEREVTARTATTAGLPCTLESLSQGKTTDGTLPKPMLRPNHWAFLTGSAIGQLPADSSAALQQDKATILGLLAQQLKGQPGALDAVRHKLLLLSGKDGQVEQEQLLLAMRQVSCDISDEEASILREALAAEALEAAAAGASCVAGLGGSITPALPRKGYLDAQQLLKQLSAAVAAL